MPPINFPVVDMASNTNPLGPSSKAQMALKISVYECHTYPQLLSLDLRDSISRETDIEVDDIFIGNGSSEIIDIIIRSLCITGRIALDTYGFIGFKNAAIANGVHIVQFSGNSLFKTSIIDSLYFMDRSVSLIFFANPSNPGGYLESMDNILAFMRRIPKNVFVVIDEAYIEYNNNYRELSCIRLLGSFNNLIVLRTFSKIYGLAGARIGYALGHNNVISRMNLVRQKFNVNLFAQVAANAALTDHVHVENSRRLNISFLDKMVSIFENFGINYYGMSGNFITISTNNSVHRKLIERMSINNILINDISKAYGLEGTIRISVANEADTDRACDIIGSIFIDQ